MSRATAAGRGSAQEACWSQDAPETISLDSLMQLFGLPYFTNRGKPDYTSHMSEYMAGLVGELDNLPDAGDFWKLSPLQKAAFKLARKLGLI